MIPSSHANHILVFRPGQLGDTLAALPALWVLRDHFPKARITLLHDKQIGKDYVLARAVFQDSPLVNDFEVYPQGIGRAGKIAALLGLPPLLSRLRRKHYDALIYLPPTWRTPRQAKRDAMFFRAAGIQDIIGAEGFPRKPGAGADGKLPMLNNEADQLLAFLGGCGFSVPPAGSGRMELPISSAHQKKAEDWIGANLSRASGPFIALGPGSKMPAKRWPEERFAEVVARLIEHYQAWPLIFGGPEDAASGKTLIAKWRRGTLAAGAGLGIPEAIHVMKRCQMYLGNDTGTMHMAACAGLPCVALFSAREHPGAWYPYGRGHRVFRHWTPCEGCMLTECTEQNMKCLLEIRPDEVFEGCKAILESRTA